MRKKLRKQEGSTLVEMIVSFSLLVILVTAVSMLIPSAMKIYFGIRSQHEQRTIVYTISNRIKADLQSAVGVGNSMDGLSGEGYLCLKKINGSTIQNVNITELTPTAPLSGNSIEFIYEEGVMERIDANGFDGLIVRNNSRIRDAYLNGSNTGIASGAAIARYYVRGNDNRWQESIVYDSLNFSTNAGVPVGDLTDGASYASAYAVECQYGENFYRGYDVKINYEIPMNAIEKDIEFEVYGGKKVKASYVKYVNYTIALYQQDELKYEQKFCANIENAVPYYGTLSTTITDGNGGSIPEPEKTLEEIIEEYKGIMWRDPAELEGYEPVVDDPSWGTTYTYMIAIAPPTPEDGSNPDVSEWMAEIQLGNYDYNGTPYLVNLQSANQWYTQHGSKVEYAYDADSKKIILRGQSLMEGEIYKCLVQIQVKHEYNKPPSEQEMMPDRYPVKVTYWRNYVTGNADGTSGNYHGVTAVGGEKTQLNYQFNFKTEQSEKRLLTFDYTFPFVIDDVSQINWPDWGQKCLGISILEKTAASTTVRFRSYDVQGTDRTVAISVSGLNLPGPEYYQNDLWEYKGTFRQVDSLPSITVMEHPDYPDYKQ